MYLLWFILYIPQRWNLFQLSTESFFEIPYRFFFRPGNHLWYLWALLISIYTTSSLFKKYPPLFILLFSLSLFFFNRFYAHFATMEIQYWATTPLRILWESKALDIQGICVSMTFVSLGMMIAIYEKKIIVCKYYIWLLLFLIGTIISMFDRQQSSVGHIFQGPSILVMCLRFTPKQFCFFRNSRIISTFIYLIHAYLISMASVLVTGRFCQWLLSLFLCVFIGYFYSNFYKKNKILTYLS